MPTYVMLANWTDQGIRAIKDAAGRIDAARQCWKKWGASSGPFT